MKGNFKIKREGRGTRGRKQRRKRKGELGEREVKGGGREGERLAHWHFDESEGERGAEEREDDHGDSLSHVHLQVLVIPSTGLAHLHACVHVIVTCFM